MRQLGHLQEAGCGSEVKRHVEEGLCTLAHTNKLSRPNHAGEGILDLAIIISLLKEQIDTYCRQLDSISSEHLPWLLTTELKIETTKHKTRKLRKSTRTKSPLNSSYAQ
ncbi:hypothetical protein EVAR_56889_1 [Eumeta japonica]|uniref:Uncharacterized protein n=1 Tax=Eumeta variegata TaxID=151549 RepID=A0A4C1ZM64_EUMVA|nr:hypothetical protein EVAR_56889_1 [Eumeta japonica]